MVTKVSCMVFFVLLTLVLCANRALAQESWKFASIPDFMNVDLATLEGYPGYPDGRLDSTTSGFEATLAFYLDAIAAEDVDFVLVAGDLVEGEWHHDPTGRRIFGNYGSLAERRSSLYNAADLYYTQWLERFTSRGLRVYPAVGDHELGDNNWGTGSSRALLVPDFKIAFARYFTQDPNGQSLFNGTINGVSARPVDTPYEDTAYAFVNKNMLIVTVDAFRQDDPRTKLDNRTGSVLGTVDGEQLVWLDALLAAARNDPGIDHIIVQAHSPVLTPVRVRGSSELYLRDYDNTTNASNADRGPATDFWQTLARHDVDFFFCGEVHDNTLSISNNVIQLVHDGIPYTQGHYLVGTVTGDQIELELNYVDIGPGIERHWNTVNNAKLETAVQGSAWETVATALYDKSTSQKRLINPTGDLIPFGSNDGSIAVIMPPSPNADLPVHLSFDNISGTSVPNAGSTGTANDATMQGGTTVVAGRFGDAVKLDGVSGTFLWAGSSPVVGNVPRTTSAWINLNTTGFNTVLTMGTNSSGRKWDIDIDEPGGGGVELGIGNGRTEAEGVNVNDGQWHLVTVVLDGDASGNSTIDLADVQFYVDGVFQYRDGDETQAINTAGDTLLIGKTPNNSGFFDGCIDDVAVWSVGLSADEVLGLYQVGVEPLLGYDASKFELLRQVHAGAFPSAEINGRTWAAYLGNTDPAGLTAKPYGFALVLDETADSGVYTVHPAEQDFDRDIDYDDYVALEACYTGPDQLTSDGCRSDIDGDGDADLWDLYHFSLCFTGVDSAPDLNCLNP